MIQLTPSRLALGCWLVDQRHRSWRMLEAQRATGVLVYGAVHRFIQQCLADGIVRRVRAAESRATPEVLASGNDRQVGFRLIDGNRLIELAALTYPVDRRPSVAFRHRSDMEHAIGLVRKTGLPHALTASAAGELIHPYVATDRVHAFVRSDDLPAWIQQLHRAGVKRSFPDEADLFLFPLDPPAAWSWLLDWPADVVMRHGVRAAPLLVVLADLLSVGGPGAEQVRLIVDRW